MSCAQSVADYSNDSTQSSNDLIRVCNRGLFDADTFHGLRIIL
jgi:hypothetical protein